MRVIRSVFQTLKARGGRSATGKLAGSRTASVNAVDNVILPLEVYDNYDDCVRIKQHLAYFPQRFSHAQIVSRGRSAICWGVNKQ